MTYALLHRPQYFDGMFSVKPIHRPAFVLHEGTLLPAKSLANVLTTYAELDNALECGEGWPERAFQTRDYSDRESRSC